MEQLALEKRLAPDVFSASLWRTQSGLQNILGMLEGLTPPAPMADQLNFCLVHVSQGRVIFQGQPQLGHLNPMGTVHGGWYATILDSALGCAVHTMLPAARAYTTSQLNIQLVRSIPMTEQRVQAVGEVVHCGRQMATAQGQLRGPAGTLYAHATCTCMIFDIPESKTP
ncbi:MAG: PaaI family thioesterase [Betaproteobacteria bacterium]|nr:PaaI family thioesterase [Betaproteobacteria bacterium]NBY06304.1 PaaI family thioesterase [Betaproteobacteria bacterium]